MKEEKFRDAFSSALYLSFITNKVVETKEKVTYFLGNPVQVTIEQTGEVVVISDIDDEWVLPLKLIGNASGHPRTLVIEVVEDDIVITEIRGRVVVDSHYTTISPGNYL